MPQVLICTLNAKYIHTNLAVRLLYQLNKHREGLSWKEFTIKEDKNAVAGYCSKYDIVAFSCYIWNISPTLEVCRLIKEISPDIKIVLGGPEVSYEYESVISRPEVNYIIAGEGEIAFEEFLSSYPVVQNVPNLIWKNGSAIISNPHAPVFDLRRLENIMPYSDDVPELLKTKVLYIETSRGCPYKCEFCLASLDNKVRYLPDGSIRATLLHMMENGKVIKFLDRTFNIKRDFTISIFEFILQNHRPGNVFQFEITADILHPDIIRFINEKVPKGLFRFEIGIQTVNQKANLAVSRKQNFEKTKAIIKQLDHKVEMHLDLIVGLPLDTFSDIKYSFEEVFRLRAPELQLGFLKFLKGTPVRDKHNEHGFIFDPEPPYQIIESNYLSKAELRTITELEHALEIYWNGSKAHKTLSYVAERYSIFDFLAGVGRAFGKLHDFHSFKLPDIFGVLRDYCLSNYAFDQFLPELVAMDYYLHFKLKPQVLFLEEVSKERKESLIKTAGGRQHGCGYVALRTKLNWQEFFEERELLHGKFEVLIKYDNESPASVILQTPEQHQDPFHIITETTVTTGT
jgi:anaerobic magnesium-protoporphyrin IX monomethyl ester cyclase